jgi:3-oxoacyl-[acyl-carrier-protein] synthase III
MSLKIYCILLVVADRTANGITRIVPPSLSIGSDAASCCLLTSGKLFDLEISGISQSMDAKMGKLDAGKDFIAYTQGVAKGVVGNIKSSLLKARVEKNNLTRVISNNYNRWVTSAMVRPTEKVSLENIPRFAHAGASDICINMADHLAASGNSKNEEILLLSTGPVMWGSAIVRNTSDQ